MENYIEPEPKPAVMVEAFFRAIYGWRHREGQDDEGERFVAVLELPPVVSPETAVRAPDAKKRGKTPKTFH